MESKIQNFEKRLQNLRSIQRKIETEFDKETVKLYESARDLKRRIENLRKAFQSISKRLKVNITSQFPEVSRIDTLGQIMRQINDEIYKRKYSKAKKLITDAEAPLRDLSKLAEALTCLSNRFVDALRLGIQYSDVSICNAPEIRIQDFCHLINSATEFSDVSLVAEGNTLYILQKGSRYPTKKRPKIVKKERAREYYLAILSSIHRACVHALAQEGSTNVEIPISSLPTPCRKKRVLRSFERSVNRCKELKEEVTLDIRKNEISLSLSGISCEDFVKKARSHVRGR